MYWWKVQGGACAFVYSNLKILVSAPFSSGLGWGRVSAILSCLVVNQNSDFLSRFHVSTSVQARRAVNCIYYYCDSRTHYRVKTGLFVALGEIGNWCAGNQLNQFYSGSYSGHV